ncbi:type I-F CRISPR-associated protein Csy1 [Acetobacteraceae bacterium]|nr:type I-F CRISPR-associated protein Csy1 [Acetobacteraceae bacterium]
MSDRSRQRIFETAIAEFLNARREEKLRGKENPSISAKYNKSDWLENTAKILQKTKVQIGTHLPKATHSDVQGGTILASSLPERSEIGTHLLGSGFIVDATGNGAENAAVLDGWNFLHLFVEVDGKRRFLKDWLRDKDEDALAALSEVKNKSENIASRFLSFIEREEKRSKEGVSDGNAKQIYWLAEGEDASKNENFILLQPLYPTSLAHLIHATLSEARYGEKAKEGREARRKNQPWDGVLMEFRGLAKRSLGGSKPQNVSQLNSLRGGAMSLFSSAPPPALRGGRGAPLLKTKKSVVRWIMQQPNIYWALSELIKLLKNNQNATDISRIQKAREGLENFIAEEITHQAAKVRNAQSAGWSDHPECELPEEERLWLDTGRVEDEDNFNSQADQDFRERYHWGDWPDLIANRMAAFINHFLRAKGKFAVGDVEHYHWARISALVIDTSWPVPFQRKSKSQRDADLAPYREKQS